MKTCDLLKNDAKEVFNYFASVFKWLVLLLLCMQVYLDHKNIEILNAQYASTVKITEIPDTDTLDKPSSLILEPSKGVKSE